MVKKKKMIALSDHALSTSGVGTQSRFLFEGLISKGDWTVRQFGAALKHTDYRTVSLGEDLIIKPIDGFGDRNLLRITLATERPEVLFIFTDPRFFIWLFEMEDEVHQICPISWWHVWDNAPYPEFNQVLYESTDLINCHSNMTYNLIKDKVDTRVNFVPHSVPEEIYKKLSPAAVEKIKVQLLGPNRKDHFIGFWANRNAKRKRPSDVMESWSMFLDKLESEHGHRNATLVMHTDPLDQEGPNLFQVSDLLGISNNIFFSTERIEFDQMNMLYNLSDFVLNISYAEGFGLSTLEAMQAGTPIIAAKTGGLTRQVEDHRDGTHNGIALDIELRTLVGSQAVPYIYEDYVSPETVSDAILELYNKSPEEKVEMSKKVMEYAQSEFNMKDTVSDWHNTLSELIDTWEYKPWDCKTF
jgi:glycosyltransferase involved in cell wall biosynthesis